MSFESLRRPVPLPETVESPCIKVCQIDLEGLCRGCGRTLNEIARWREMSNAERVLINQRVGFGGHRGER